MADKKSSESRRKLLKSIAVGSGAIVTGKSLPESWSRPIADSVMLPVHAQTSPPTSPPTTCTLPKTIPSASVNCSYVGFEILYYAIRTADEPCGYQVISSSTQPSDPHIRIITRQDTQIGSVIDIESYDLGGTLDDAVGGNAQCNVNQDPDEVVPLPIPAYDETGRQYTLDGSITASAGTVTMSELTITPV